MQNDDVVVRMPALGEAATEGTVARWLRSPGDRVTAGEAIAEIVTDKVSQELLSPVDGNLGTPRVFSGHVAPVGTELVTISPRDVSGAPVHTLAPLPSQRGRGWGGGFSWIRESAAEAPARVSPLVRRMADEHGIDLGSVVGSGPAGRVTKDDIVEHIASRAHGAGLAVAAPSADRDEEVHPPSPLRQVIAANLVRAVQGVPQAWTLVEVDASALLAFRDAHRERVARAGHSLGAFASFVHVAARVIERHPLVNASWRDGTGATDAIGDLGGRVVTRRTVHAGIAVARPGGGLLVPVIRDAAHQSLDALVASLDTAVRGARNGTLGADAYAGATVTLNNTGALGSVVSQPILPPGTSAIIAFEAIVKRPVVVAGDAIAIRPMVNVCLTFDHRVLDGLEACAFLQDLKRSVESLDVASHE